MSQIDDLRSNQWHHEWKLEDVSKKLDSIDKKLDEIFKTPLKSSVCHFKIIFDELYLFSLKLHTEANTGLKINFKQKSMIVFEIYFYLKNNIIIFGN